MTLNDIIKKINHTMGEEENTTPDYNWKLNETIDSVQREIATLGKMIKKSKYVSADEGIISLPTDVYEVIKLMDEENNTVRYVRIDIKNIKVETDGDYILVYYAYPTRITSTTSLSTELELPVEALEILKYGVCAELNISDDPEKYSIYKGKYETLLANIIELGQTNKVTITGGIRL